MEERAGWSQFHCDPAVDSGCELKEQEQVSKGKWASGQDENN